MNQFKLEKVPQMIENPSAAWEQIQILRIKLNEVISILNKETEISGESKDEKHKRLVDELRIATKNLDFKTIKDLSTQFENL